LVRNSPCKFCICVMFCCRRSSIRPLSIICVVLSGSLALSL
jgi:hypothetical protein